MVRIYGFLMPLRRVLTSRIVTYSFSTIPVNSDAKNIKMLSPCWSCKKYVDRKTETFFCGGCGILQPILQETNYFDIFKLKANFLIDTAQLDAKYKSLFKILHPDKYTLKSAPEQSHSSNSSSFLSIAYHVLKNPITRAQYILQMLSIKLEPTSQMNPEFLLELLEIRETVDSTENKEELNNVLQKVEHFVAEDLQNLTCLFSNCTIIHSDASDKHDNTVDIRNMKIKDEDLEKAKSILSRLSYWQSLMDSIKLKL